MHHSFPVKCFCLFPSFFSFIQLFFAMEPTTTTPAQSETIPIPKTPTTEQAKSNYVFTKKSALGMFLVAIAAVVGRYILPGTLFWSIPSIMSALVNVLGNKYKVPAPTITFTRCLMNLVVNLICCAIWKVDPIGPWRDWRKFLWVVCRGLFGGIQITCYFFAFVNVFLPLPPPILLVARWWCHRLDLHLSRHYCPPRHLHVEGEMDHLRCRLHPLVLRRCPLRGYSRLALPRQLRISLCSLSMASLALMILRLVSGPVLLLSLVPSSPPWLTSPFVRYPSPRSCPFSQIGPSVHVFTMINYILVFTMLINIFQGTCSSHCLLIS